MSYTETEVKFHVADLDKLAEKLEALGATLASPRTHEMNLRFDTPAGTLAAQACVLRLRQDAQPKLTFKGPSTRVDGIVHREEIEFSVSDFDAARLFLERLGYQVYSVYEKYRTSYTLGDAHFDLDEMPYGNFLEIEGKSMDAIHSVAEQLSLRWDAVVKMGYLTIFRHFRDDAGLSAPELTFDAFDGLQVNLSEIGILPADE